MSPALLDPAMGDNHTKFENIHIKIILADEENYLNYRILFWETTLD